MPSFRNPFKRRKATPGGAPDLWLRCPGCSELLFKKSLEKGLRVCTSCGHHFRVPARERIALLLDRGSFQETDPFAVHRSHDLGMDRDHPAGAQTGRQGSRHRIKPPKNSLLGRRTK